MSRRQTSSSTMASQVASDATVVLGSSALSLLRNRLSRRTVTYFVSFVSAISLDVLKCLASQQGVEPC